MADSSSEGGTSLPSHPTAPARTAARAWSSAPKLVRTRTRGGGRTASNPGRAATPPPPGITRSSRTTSGTWRARGRRPRSSTSHGLAYHLEPVARAEERAQALTDHGVVVDHQHGDGVAHQPGHRARTVVPEPRLRVDGQRPAEVDGPLSHRHAAQGAGTLIGSVARVEARARRRAPTSSTASVDPPRARPPPSSPPAWRTTLDTASCAMRNRACSASGSSRPRPSTESWVREPVGCDPPPRGAWPGWRPGRLAPGPVAGAGGSATAARRRSRRGGAGRPRCRRLRGAGAARTATGSARRGALGPGGCAPRGRRAPGGPRRAGCAR